MVDGKWALVGAPAADTVELLATEALPGENGAEPEGIPVDAGKGAPLAAIAACGSELAPRPLGKMRDGVRL